MAKKISERPEIINKRKEFGHWDIDSIKSTNESGTKKCIFTLTERLTKANIQIEVPDGKAETIVKVLNKLEKSYGIAFSEIFKSLTSDNGVEFADETDIQVSALDSQKLRTVLYKCRPYHSWERGTNERNNREIRRAIPKGTRIEDVDAESLARITYWINNQIRKKLGYKSAVELFNKNVEKICEELGINIGSLPSLYECSAIKIAS